MKKVYQRIQGTGGDCFKCCICTLLGLDYEAVPNFCTSPKWLQEAQDFCKEHGYEMSDRFLNNPLLMYLENPTLCCRESMRIDSGYSLDAIKKMEGVDGLFLAGVYSPGLSDANEHPAKHLHAVLCDRDFHIVFDPNPKYQDVVCYPYAPLIGYNGIRDIVPIRKIKD